MWLLLLLMFSAVGRVVAVIFLCSNFALVGSTSSRELCHTREGGGKQYSHDNRGDANEGNESKGRGNAEEGRKEGGDKGHAEEGRKEGGDEGHSKSKKGSQRIGKGKGDCHKYA